MAGFHAHPVGKSRDIQGVGRKQVFRMPGKVEFGRFAFGQRARPGAVQAYQIPQERKSREKTGFPVLCFKKRELYGFNVPMFGFFRPAYRVLIRGKTREGCEKP